MKVITLVPAKNESWILEFSLANFSIFSDEIIVLDDGSTDNTKQVCESFKKVKVVPFDASQEKFINMSTRRNVLLDEGRKLGGTHFVFLDADEVISDPLAHTLKQHIEKMTTGETIYMPWVLAFADNKKSFNFDASMSENYKDFIFCDDCESEFENKALSEDRTPNNQKQITKINFEIGCVYHLQELALARNKLKQIRYRCNELLEGKRSARRINATYDYTKNLKPKVRTEIDDEFFTKNSNKIRTEDNTYFEILLNTLNKKELDFFEPVDIWDNPTLYKMFTNKYGRPPKPEKFPKIIIQLNNIKNIIRNGKLFVIL